MADLIAALHAVEQQLEADMRPVYAAYVAEARDELTALRTALAAVNPDMPAHVAEHYVKVDL